MRIRVAAIAAHVGGKILGSLPGLMNTPSHTCAALASEHAARTAAEQQLAQKRRALLAEVQAARTEGDAVLRQQQHQAIAQQRQLEAELERQAAAAAERQAAAAVAHATALQQLEVRSQSMQLDGGWVAAPGNSKTCINSCP